MFKTTFNISKLDCPSEEQLIRMRLAGLNSIQQLDFDIAKRQLVVYHQHNHEPILEQLQQLQLNTTLLETQWLENLTITAEDANEQKKLLIQVLVINFIFFLLEVFTGLFSHSIGLLADSLDMLADSIVYGLSLLAVTASIYRKHIIAKSAGYFQLMLGILGFFEALRRFVGNEQNPDYTTMMIVSVLALMGNGICLYLLQKSKSQEVHMQASRIFTSSDIIINLGVMLAGLMVYLTGSRYPDLVIGSIVFVIVAEGALKILKLAK